MVTKISQAKASTEHGRDLHAPNAYPGNSAIVGVINPHPELEPGRVENVHIGFM